MITKSIFTAGLLLTSLSSFAVTNVFVSKYDPAQAIVEIRGVAADQIYATLLQSGMVPTNAAHRGLLVGKNLSCYMEKENSKVCSFITIGGESEPNVTDGQAPHPGVTVSN